MLSPKDIRRRVLAEIKRASGCPDNKLPDHEVPHDAMPPRGDSRYETELDHGLDMNGPRRRSMQPEFKSIARENDPGASITPGECEDLKTIGEAVALVLEKAKTKSEQAAI